MTPTIKTALLHTMKTAIDFLGYTHVYSHEKFVDGDSMIETILEKMAQLKANGNIARCDDFLHARHHLTTALASLETASRIHANDSENYDIYDAHVEMARLHVRIAASHIRNM